MALDRLGPLGVWGHLDSLRAPEVRAYARRVERLGYGALWVPEVVGREPFALLALLAGTTERLVLGTSIASIWARDAQTCRMAAATLTEATDGRFVLGLGVSHPHLAEKLRGHAWERPVATMRGYLAAYRTAIYRGPTAAVDPPILVAALRARMSSLAATDANGAFPYLVTAARLAWMRRHVDDAAAAGNVPRPFLAVTLAVALSDAGVSPDAARAYLAPYLRTPAYRQSWARQGFEGSDWEHGASERLVHAMVACGDVDAVRARIEELHAAGADHVALIPLDPDGRTEHLETLDRLAA